MKLNSKMKSALVALPLLLLVGCSSSSSDDMANNGDGSMGSGSGYPAGSSDSSSWNNNATLQQLQESNTIYFGFDRYDLSPQYANELNAHADFLRKNSSMAVTIEGHADERGTPEYNIALGERRANAVKMYLQGRGVPSSQMNVVSYGKEKPAVLGHDEDAYAQNRRAVVVY